MYYIYNKQGQIRYVTSSKKQAICYYDIVAAGERGAFMWQEVKQRLTPKALEKMRKEADGNV